MSFVTGSAFVEEDFCCSVAVEEITAAEEWFGESRGWEVTAAEAWVCAFARVA
jgi:hypothetical protein